MCHRRSEGDPSDEDTSRQERSECSQLWVVDMVSSVRSRQKKRQSLPPAFSGRNHAREVQFKRDSTGVATISASRYTACSTWRWMNRGSHVRRNAAGRRLVPATLVVALATASLSLISIQAVGSSAPEHATVSFGSSVEPGELSGVTTTRGGDAWAVATRGTRATRVPTLTPKQSFSFGTARIGSRCQLPVLQTHSSAASPPLHPQMRGLWAQAASSPSPMR